MMVEITKPAWMMAAIAAGLLVWAVVLAWGVIRNQPVLDLRKPLMILGVVALFLGGWATLLLFRSLKSR